MKNKQKEKLIVPVSKPRNLLSLNPLMSKGGAFSDNKKGQRKKDKSELTKLKNESKIDDDYGFNP